MTALTTIDTAHVGLATPQRLDELFTDIRHDLAEAVTLSEHARVAAEARAFQSIVRRAKVAEGIRYDANKLAVQAELALADAVAAAPKNRGTRGVVQPGMRGTGGVLSAPPVADAAPRLVDVGISKARAKIHRAVVEVSGRLRAEFFTRGDERRRPEEMTVRRLITFARWQHTGRTAEFHPMIKPSDNWNFGSQDLLFPKLAGGTEADEWGYIPGDLYANCLWYWTKPGDLVVAPMAGSGMIRHVYQGRERWMRPEPWELDLRMFDLAPRGPYRELIGRHDLTEGFPPVERAPDYVVMDVPYFGISRGQYGTDPGNLANLEWDGYLRAMARIAAHCAATQEPGGRLTFISPNFSDVKAGEPIPAAHILTRTFEDAGYTLVAKAYSTRRIQQIQGHHMAVKNNWARRQRIMLTDISEIVTLRRG